MTGDFPDLVIAASLRKLDECKVLTASSSDAYFPPINYERRLVAA
jgi:hypothetical protein